MQGRRYSGKLEFEYSAPETLIDIPFVRFSAPVKGGGGILSFSRTILWN